MESVNKQGEQEPLLRRSSSAVSSHSEDKAIAGTKWLGFHTVSRSYRWIPLLGCLIIFINEAEYFLKQVAAMRALEAMYCYEYYQARHSPLVELGKKIPERLCKADSIQKNLATSAGLINFTRMLSAMIGAIPLGWVADRYGRKPVLVLHKVNVVCACASWTFLYLGFPRVPIWSLYLSGTPGLIGGNYDIGAAMLFAAYTDVMPSSAERASLFFLTTSMQYLAETFCPAIGAWLMNLDGKGGTPEVNLLVSLGLSVLTALITISFFPETVQESRESANPEVSHVEQGATSAGGDSQSKDEGRSSIPRWVCGVVSRFASTVSGLGVLNCCLLFVSICFAATGIKAIDWYALVQYPVVKLHWTFPQSSAIVSMEGFLMLIHFSLLLPLLNRTAAARLGPAKAHFAIMAGSAILLTLGALGMGFSSTGPMFIACVIVYLFGEGLPTATQAYIVSLVERSKVARIMATLSIASIFGKVAASILFPKMLGWGIDLHNDILLGLPLFVTAGLFVVSAACVGIVGYRMDLSRRDAPDF